MPRLSIASTRRLAAFLGATLVLSCAPQKLDGPRENRGPTARLVLPSGPLLEGSEITFDASSSSDPDGDSLTYLWDLGDSLMSTSSTVSRLYVDNGHYAVTLIVSDPDGASDTVTAPISVENAAPVVAGIVGPAGSIGVGNPTALRVSVSDPGTADLLTIRIDWKDGITSTAVYQPSQQAAFAAHTYSAVGTYAVEITIQDNDGAVTKRTIDRSIVVVPQSNPGENRAPTAEIVSPPGPFVEGRTVVFDGNSSSDPDGDSLSYRWDMGNESRQSGSYGVSTYADDGTYVVTLIVTDQHGAGDTATTQVHVENALPFISYFIAPSGAVLAGTSTTIQVSVRDSGATDSLTLEIDWKDGTTYEGAKLPWYLAGATLAHTYSTPGTYAVGATVRDDDGGVGKSTVGPIVVVGLHKNHPPVARIEGSTSGSEGSQLRFSADASTDPDGDSLKATWFSGDGRSKTTPYPRTYPRTNTHWWTYPDNGTYIVSVIVADDSGAADTASMQVTVENTPPTVAWYSMPYREVMGMPGSIQVLVEDSGKADRQEFAVDWGDGTSRSLATADSSIWIPFEGNYAFGATILHSYATTGTYTITVTARDDDGAGSSPIVSSPVLVFNANERQTVGGYEAIDIGTLPGGNAARPEDINDRGQVVGTSLTGTWADHAFLWDASGMHDLGTMEHEGSEAIRINEAGVIAGTVWTHTVGIPGHNEISVNIGTIWQNGLPRALDSTQVILTAGGHGPYCSGPLFSLESPRVVRALNSSGDVAWASYSRSCTSGWLWNGSWQRLPSLPMAMNDRGQVVGASVRGDSPWYYHAFLAEGGISRELGVLASWTCGSGVDCSMAEATDINKSGQVVGISTDGAGRYHFVLWQDDKIKDLGFADWTYPQVVPHIVINDRGEIAGSVAGKAFFWDADSMTSLPSGGGSLVVVGLNENGEVVGTIQMGAEQHAFVWSLARGMVDLGTGPDGFSGAWVVDINARGDILGYTAPCKPTLGNRCADNTRNPGSLQGTQVRGILWRKQ